MIKIKKICIITDFDHTITSKDSKSTWDVLETPKEFPKKYRNQCQKNRQYYLPIEKDYKISFIEKSKYMKEWLEKNLEMFVKSEITKENIKNASKVKKCMTLRKEAKTMFDYAKKQNIPIIIISAGITDIIQNFLSANDLLTENVHIISNKLKFKDDKIIGLEGESIHSLNKAQITLQKNLQTIIEKSQKIYLLGDNVEDALLAPTKDTIKIGFLEKEANLEEYQKAFDRVLKNATFKDVLSIIKST